MIPVLFKANAVDFSTFGIGVLADCISCEVTEERNGSYELVLQYPVTGRNYGELSSERIIKAKPNDTADDQAFRIYRITTPIDGVVTVKLSHSYSPPHRSRKEPATPPRQARTLWGFATEKGFATE